MKKVRDLQAQLKQRHEQLQQEVAALQQERDLAAHIDVSDLEEEVASIDQVIRETQQRQELVKAELKRVGRPSAARWADPPGATTTSSSSVGCD